MSRSLVVDDAALAELSATFSSDLVRPGDTSYDEVRRVHNGLVDKRPALIARCRGPADVVDVIRFALQRSLPVSVRGGGHSVAGRSVIDDGIVIDLGPMKGLVVDPKSRTLHAQGGVTWKEFNRETAIHGLATTGGFVSTTGSPGSRSAAGSAG